MLLDEDGDLLIRNGDFVCGEASEDNVALLLVTHPGEVRNSPLTGFGLASHLRRPSSPMLDEQMERELTLQLELDGSPNSDVRISRGNIHVKRTNYSDENSEG